MSGRVHSLCHSNITALAREDHGKPQKTSLRITGPCVFLEEVVSGHE